MKKIFTLKSLINFYSEAFLNSDRISFDIYVSSIHNIWQQSFKNVYIFYLIISYCFAVLDMC